ncbi:MAG: hypothetical protein KC736_04130 [Candidatus Moranbacteria bacterium]|nr:hypothetical protein [Candidatus Moranbacteria bacterium]
MSVLRATHQKQNIPWEIVKALCIITVLAIILFPVRIIGATTTMLIVIGIYLFIITPGSIIMTTTIIIIVMLMRKI